jgi:hypothetical protein
VNSRSDKASGVTSNVEAVREGGAPGSGSHRPFYSSRFRTYSGLLAFVVVVGLPLLAIPSLRHRLTERVELLRDAMAGRSPRSHPILVTIGQTHEQLPQEFERPVPPPPSSAAVSPDMPAKNVPAKSPISQGVRKPAKDRTELVLRVPKPPAETTESRPSTEQTPAVTEQASEPIYRQGKMEREAYDVLLQSSSIVAGMVHGENTSLRFQDWNAAKMEEDMFWVRLTFTRLPEKTPVTYIWQVKLLSKEVTPLSYEARTLPKS